MSSWAAAWVLLKGKEIRFDKSFLDVAVKLHSILGGRLSASGGAFLLHLPSLAQTLEFKVDKDFVRGLLEAGGIFEERAIFIPKLPQFKDELSAFLSQFSPKETEEGYFITGEKALLLAHTLYDEETQERAELFFEKFLKMIAGADWKRERFYFSLEEGALPPFKKRVSDSGFDLHLIKLIKQEGSLYLFDTGVRVAPPEGYYFDLVPRSSIYKSGFILANSVGIIDRTYRGTVKVPLVKVREDAPSPQLPWRAVQLIPRRFFPLEAEERENLDETLRGEGGFGSTG